jgi:hypothetical protein
MNLTPPDPVCKFCDTPFNVNDYLKTPEDRAEYEKELQALEQQGAEQRESEFFRVEVSDHRGQIVAIEPQMLAGRDIGAAERAKVSCAAGQLLAFIGERTAPAPALGLSEDERALVTDALEAKAIHHENHAELYGHQDGFQGHAPCAEKCRALLRSLLERGGV